MSTLQIVLIFACVLTISSGQVLFRKTGLEIELHGLWHLRPLLFAGVALIVYGVATLAWIYVLRKVPLSLAYPFVAMSFVIVPLLARWVFDEPLNLSYFLGTGLIVTGVGVVAYGSTQPS